MGRFVRPGRLLLLASIALALLLPGAAVAQNQNDEQRSNTGERELLSQLGDARIYRNDATGKVSLIGATARQDAINRPAGLSANASPVAAARAHLSKYGALFGLRNQAQELRSEEAGEAGKGRSLVHFQQVYQDVPVLGGELNVQLNSANELLVTNGEILPNISLDTDPAVSAGEARDSALQKIAKHREEDVGGLRASDPELWIYDPTLLGDPSIQVPTLVWRMEVTPEGLDHFNELVLVDAQWGNVALNFDQVHTAKNRQTYNANNTRALPGTLVCNETNPSCTGGDADAVAAHRHAGDTYDFYATNHGRDSIDGAGMSMISTVHYDTGYQNAFWSGTQMVYGDGYGFALADDVVGHEFAHGVTQHESHLFYYYQSGAIDESFSDVWGEFVDLTNGSGTDTDATRWQFGEDVAGRQAFRDMEDPTLFLHPDRMQSPYYHGGERNGVVWDNGGVHINSGVNNKAAFLMTDGGTFNGFTVSPLGATSTASITEVAKIYYEVQANLLTSASDYNDLYATLQQACTTLTGTSGITASDCQEVKDAVDATEMDQTPAAAPNPEAPVCPTGETATNLFFDDLENTASGNWSTAGEWYYPQNSNPYDFDATYATSGNTNIWGYARNSVGDYAISRTADVTPPGGKTTYLRFNHAYRFEYDSTRAFDGGVLEYSTDNGTTWLDAGALITDNGYNGTLTTGFSNPLAGRSGFVRKTNGYISSRVDLSSLAGQNVRFRFRIGTDNGTWGYGWFIDDVRVYTCDVPDTIPPSAPAINSPANNSFDTDGTITFSGTAEANSTVEVFEGDASRVTTTADSSGAWSKALTGVPDGSHSYTAKATDVAGNTSAESATRTVKVDTARPKVKRVVPAENATGIAPGTNVSAFFSEAMRAGSINTNTIKLFKAGTTTPLAAVVSYDAATKKAVLNPDANLLRGAKYKVAVTAGAKDLAGNALDQNPSVTGNQPKAWFFTVRN